MQPQPPDPEPRRFGPVALWIETGRALQRHARPLIQVLLLPSMLQLVLLWIVGTTAATGRAGLFWLCFAGVLLAIALFATNCHRVVLGDSAPLLARWGLWLDRRVLRYLGWMVLLVMLVGAVLVPVFLAGALMVPALLEGLTPGETGLVVRTLGWIAGVLLAWLVCRLSLILPAAAIGRSTTLGEAWYLSEGQGWRLVVGLAVPTLGVGLLMEVLGRAALDSGSTLLFMTWSLVNILASAVAVVALSCAWRLLGPDREAGLDGPAGAGEPASVRL